MADVDEKGMDGIDLYADVDDFAPEGEIIEADLYDDVISSSHAAVASSGRVSGIGGSVGASSGVQSQADSSLDIDTKQIGGDSFRGQPRSVGFSKRHAIIIANLTWWTTDRDITDAVANCGVADLKDIKFYENRVNGQSKGFATVILESEQSCRLVIDKLPSRELHGQTPTVTSYSRAAIERFDTTPSAPTGTPSSSSKQNNSHSKDSEMNSFHNGHYQQQQQLAQQQHAVNSLAAPAHMLPLSVAGPPPQLPPGMQLHMLGAQQPTAQNIAVSRGMLPGGLGLPPRPAGPGVFVSGAPPGFTGMLPPLASSASRDTSVPPPMFVPPPNSSGPRAAQLIQPPPRLPPPNPGALPPNHVSLGLPPPVATSMGQPPPGMTAVAPPRILSVPPPGMMSLVSQQAGGMILRGPGGLTQVIDPRTLPPPAGGARLDFLHLRPPPGPDPFQPGGVASSPAAVAAVAAALHQQRTQTPAVSIAGLPPGHQLQQLGVPGMQSGAMSVPPPHLLLSGLTSATGTAVSAAAAISSHQTLATQHVNQAFYTAVSAASMHLPVGSMVQLDVYGRPISVPAPAGVPAPSSVVAASPVAGHAPAAAAASSDPYQQLRSGGSSSHHHSSGSAARESPVDRRGTPGYSSSDRYRHHRSRSPAPRERGRERDRERERERERDSSVDSYHRGGTPRSQSRTRHDSLAGGVGGSGSHHHISSAEFEEILQRNKTVSSSAISRAVQDASAGEFVSAIETLVTAIALIKQSRIAHDDRCRILIGSLQDTLHGIESKSYTSGSSGGVSGSGGRGGGAYKSTSSSVGGGGSSREQHRQRSPPRSSRDHSTNGVEKSRSGGGDYHRSRSREERGRGEYSSRSSGMERERTQRDIERERSSRDMEASSRHYESSSASSADRRERDAYRERGMDRDREREREREREYASRSSRH